MNILFRTTIILLLVLLVSMCKPGNQTTRHAQASEPFHLLAKSELGDKFSVEFSEDGRFVLCKSSVQSDPSVSHYTVKFFVMDSSSGEILYSDNLARGEIEWYNAQTVKVSTIPGIIMPDAQVISNIYLYNVVTGKKTTLGSSEKF